MSPDIQPAGIACAALANDGALLAFVGQVIDAGLDPGSVDCADDSDWTRFPNLGEVCDFMNEAGQWDGIDRRWNNAVVLPYLQRRFTGALAGSDGAATVCPNGAKDIAGVPAAPRAVAGVASECRLIQAFCVGSDVTRNDVAPPFYNPDGLRTVAGCSVAVGGGRGCGGCLALLFLTLLGLARRRTLVALIVLGGCAPGLELSGLTTFEPFAADGTFSYVLYAPLDAPGDGRFEKRRIEQLERVMLLNHVCPAGYEITDRKVVRMGGDPIGERVDYYYRGKCK